MKNYILLFLIMFLSSCSVYRINKGNLSWRYSYNLQYNYDLDTLNNKIVLGSNYKHHYLFINPQNGSLVKETRDSLYKIKNLRDGLMSTDSLRYFVKRRTLYTIHTNEEFGYTNLKLISADPRYRGENYRHFITLKRKSDLKEFKIKFRKAFFEYIYDIIPRGSSDIIIQFRSSMDTLYHQEIGLLNLNAIIKKR